jgi:rod shape-determining protein MreC
MKNVLELLFRIGYHILFFLMMGLSIYLIVRYNQSQREIFINTTNIVASSINTQSNKVEEFINLKAVNEELKKQNADLVQQLLTFKLSPIVIPSYKADTLQYSLTPVSICNSTYSLRNNNLTLCNGSNLGILVDQGVISENGVIGIVRNVSPNYSRVMSILHSQSVIDCALRKTGAHGSLIWDGSNPKIMNLTDIPKHIIVTKGDTVETSGFSTIFPKGILVGKVREVTLDKGSNIFDIKVDLFHDPTVAKYGYVINNKKAEEQRQIEKDE